MSSAKAKGRSREREARDIYEAAGYAVQPFYGRRFGETDGFGLMDFVAVRRDPPAIVFAQVKSNRARGMGDWFAHADALLPDTASAHYLICYDREGWRLVDRDGSGGYRTAYDEREDGANMGDGLAGWLSP